MKNWLIFIKERFSPLDHGSMLALYLFIHLRVAENLEEVTLPFTKFIALCVGVVVFFFTLRLYDEIKDYETDLTKNPTRPLPRGLLTVSQVKVAFKVTLFLSAVLFLFVHPLGSIAAFIALGYSLLMYREFFIGHIIGKHLTTYAVSHTFVTYLMGLGIMSMLLQRPVWELSYEAHLFSLSNWALFNIFEFGRKTYSQEEEREGVDTYSSLFGRLGAVALLMTQVLASNYLFYKLPIFEAGLIPHLFFTTGGVLTLGLIYTIINTPKISKLYRALSSGYIIVIYLLLAGYFVR